MMTIQERKELLAIPCWNYKQVMQYTGYKKSKAFEVIAICKEKLNGKVMFNDHVVKRNAVLAYMGSSVEQEKVVIKQLEDEEDNQT